ncbi:MAG: terminase family protein [Spirochaetota bacterium]|nr:terminase family protein [Spirochaetota bacterium]
MAFTLYTKEDYIVNWHHEYLCDKLNDFVNGKIKRMMVFMAPQHGKSELTSRRLPAFMLGKNPNLRIALCAYNATFASKFNRQVQRIMTNQSYLDVFPKTQLNSKNVATDSKGAYLRNSEQFEIVDKNGSFISVGVGGGITGNPVDVALIDDPIKGAEEAGSQIYREKLWEWYTSELETRLNNSSQILITLTRWNIDDLAGRILKHSEDEYSKKWEIVIFPRIKVDNSNPNDPRKVGETLWKEVHSLESALESRQRNPVKFEALQQQNPKVMEFGNEFYKGFDESKHIKRCKYNPDISLHISLDENVNPYITGTIYQIIDKTIYQIDEICLAHPKNTLKELALEFSLRYSDHTTGVFLYGDATSKKADTKLEKGQNFFTLFCKYIAEFNPALRVPNSNPSVAMRGNFINEVFENNQSEIYFYIDPSCHNSIADFRFVKEAPDGTKFKQMETDVRTKVRYEKYGHCSDTFDYLITKAFESEYNRFQRKDIETKPIIGYKTKRY